MNEHAEDAAGPRRIRSKHLILAVAAVFAAVLSGCDSSAGHGSLASPAAGSASDTPPSIGLSVSTAPGASSSSPSHDRSEGTSGTTTHAGGGGGGGGTHNPGHVSVQVDGPASYRGWCPVQLTYTATITVQHVPADVTYHWNDGTASAGAPTLHVTHSPVHVSRTINPADSTSGTIGLDVVSPVSVSSNTAHFSIACQSVSVHASNNTSAYTGDCSHPITFITTGTVSVTNGPFTLQYRWLRSDGATTSPQTLSFGPGSSTQTVSTSWTSTPPGSTTRWQQLQILGSHGVTSNQATFTFTCA